MNGAIGRVTSVHFEWLLDETHGADYFRRWQWVARLELALWMASLPTPRPGEQSDGSALMQPRRCMVAVATGPPREGS